MATGLNPLFVDVDTTGPVALKHPDQANATLLDRGVLLIEPETSTESSLLLSCGIHGNETAPIEIVTDIIHRIFQGELKVVNRTLFVLGNPVAMELGQRFKDENLNRLFCGNFKQTDGLEARRAERLEQHTRQFFDNSPGKRFHYDLHTAIRGSRFEKFAIYPFQHEKPWQKSQLEFLAACGVNTILLNHTPASTFSYYSSRTFDAHSFTIELGKVRPFGENDMTRFSAISDCMCQLIQGEDVKVMPFENKNFNIFKVVAELIKRTDEFKLCITEDVRNFTRFPSGHLVAEDGEERYITQQEGECIIFPNANVGIGQRAALMVVPVTLL